MKVMVIGADGYIGRELCRKLQDKHDVATVDSLWRRYFMDGTEFESAIPVSSPKVDKVIDISENYYALVHTIKEEDPDIIINLGQIPIPTHSMVSPIYSAEVQRNNVIGSLFLYWAVKEANPEIPIITIGTLGEYGLPDYPLPDGGWVEFKYKGHKDTVPTPRYTLASLYHVSKTQSAYNAYFACKIWGLTIIEIQQGPVFGARTDTWFYFDWVSGTAINRICAQAIVGEVLRYGSGEQTRGYISLEDSTNAIMTVMKHAHNIEGYKAVNQFDPNSVLSNNQIIDIVREIGGEMGIEFTVRNIKNPRIEKERHFYEPEFRELPKMGFKPKRTVEEEIADTLVLLLENRDRILKYKHTIMPQKVLGWIR